MRMKLWRSDTVLRRVNRVLLAVIVCSNGYVLVSPLLPKADFEIKQRITKPVKVNPGDDTTITKIDRSRNHLILPSLQLDEPILEGDSPSTVNNGIWRRPQTSTPGKGSNTVLVGHRFTYQGAAVFYNLDKLKINDDIFLVYDKKIYRYKVTTTKIVPPAAIEVEAPTNTPQLTLYTCIPLITAKDRLVYTAEPMGVL